MKFENLTVGQSFYFDAMDIDVGLTKHKYRKVSDNHYCFDHDPKPIQLSFVPQYYKVTLAEPIAVQEADVVSGPQHQHDSTCCRFLGRRGTVDVYWCSGDGSLTGNTLIGRFGSDGPDYASSMTPMCLGYAESYLFGAYGWYHFCLLEGIRLGLLPKEEVTKVMTLYRNINLLHGIRQEEWMQLGSDERMSDKKGIV